MLQLAKNVAGEVIVKAPIIIVMNNDVCREDHCIRGWK